MEDRWPDEGDGSAQASAIEAKLMSNISQKKKPGDRRAFVVPQRANADLVGRGRLGELGSETFQRLECLLGQIRIEARDLLRVGDEGLVG